MYRKRTPHSFYLSCWF